MQYIQEFLSEPHVLLSIIELWTILNYYWRNDSSIKKFNQP